MSVSYLMYDMSASRSLVTSPMKHTCTVSHAITCKYMFGLTKCKTDQAHTVPLHQAHPFVVILANTCSTSLLVCLMAHHTWYSPFIPATAKPWNFRVKSLHEMP